MSIWVNSRWAKNAARAALLAAGFLALGAGPAVADVTRGDSGVLSGNQIAVPVSVPIDVSGNAVALNGHSVAGSTGGAAVRRAGRGGGPRSGRRTSGAGGVGSGNQVGVPISAPAGVCGNALAIFGRAAAGCDGGAEVVVGDGGTGRTSGQGAVLGGNQVDVPVTAPVSICGNTAAVLGKAVAGCKGGATVGSGGSGRSSGHDHPGHGGERRPAGPVTSGRRGVGSGDQVQVPVQAPADACGNAAGNALAGCAGGSTPRTGRPGGHGPGPVTSGRGGAGSGDQVAVPVTAPVNVCGNAAAILGDAAAGCAGVISAPRGSAGYGRTSGAGGVLAGDQVSVPVSAPVNVCGNAAAGAGRAVAGCGGDPCASSSHARFHRELAELPQLPADAMSRSGAALPANPGAMPVLPHLRFIPLWHFHRMMGGSLPGSPVEAPGLPRPVPARQDPHSVSAPSQARSASSGSGPAGFALAGSDPARSMLRESGPARSAPAGSGPARSALAGSDPAWSTLRESGPARSAPAGSDPARSGQGLPYAVTERVTPAAPSTPRMTAHRPATPRMTAHRPAAPRTPLPGTSVPATPVPGTSIPGTGAPGTVAGAVPGEPVPGNTGGGTAAPGNTVPGIPLPGGVLSHHRLAELAGPMPGALPEPPRPALFAARTAAYRESVPSLPDLPSVPLVRPMSQVGAGLPGHGAMRVPAVGGPPRELPSATNVSAEPRSQAESGALGALALAGLLAGSTGAISMVRRLRDR